MRNSNGPAFDQTEGIVPISAIIDEKYKNKAIQIAAYLKAISLTGDYSSPSVPLTTISCADLSWFFVGLAVTFTPSYLYFA